MLAARFASLFSSANGFAWEEVAGTGHHFVQCFKEFKGAFYVGCSSPLGAAILRVAHDPGLRDSLGRAAQERAAKFSPEHLAEQTAALYRELLRGRRRRS